MDSDVSVKSGLMTSAPAQVLEEAAIDVLRDRTHLAHQTLERSLHIARPDAGRAEFLSYLRALHAWQASFEAQLWDSPWPLAMRAGERGGKCAWMLADLANCEVPALDERPDWQPPLRTQAERIGLAYVVEGAQLGTQVLSKRLSASLQGWQPRWLQGYGNKTGERWRSFLAQLELLLASPAEREEAAAAALLAFESLTEWFHHCGAASAPVPIRSIP